MAILLNLSIIMLYSNRLLQNTFAGQTLFVVLLGLEASIVLHLHADSIGIFDALAVSRFPAVMQIILKVFMSVAIIISFLLGRLNLEAFYIIQALLTFVITFNMLHEIIKYQKQKYPVKIDHGNKA